jgi:nicotinate-nucleotide adenylyltransferase
MTLANPELVTMEQTALAALRGLGRVVVFGGSFDPPHLAHVELPRLVMTQLNADAVLYVPAGRAPHKLDKIQTDAAHRLAMLQLTLANHPWALIWPQEIRRAKDGEPSYTVDTLTDLRQRLGDQIQLHLLIGGDQLRIFDTWKDAARIGQLAQPVVMVRPPDTRASLLAALPQDADRAAWAQRFLELPPRPESSTDIRKHVERGDGIDALVTPNVARYIAAHHLYQ